MALKVVKIVSGAFDNSVSRVNEKFNSLSARRKKVLLLIFGISVSVISVMLIIRALQPRENGIHIEAERITVPYDIFMKDENSLAEDQLMPVGKMKGEVEGEFESFYVAVDGKGSIFINCDIEYTENAYEKNKNWQQISREKLAEYEQELHFIPAKKGIKR